MAGLVRFLRHRAQTLRSSGRGTPSMAGRGAGGGGGIGGGLVPPSLLSADRYHHSSNCMADRAVKTAAAAHTSAQASLGKNTAKAMMQY